MFAKRHLEKIFSRKVVAIKEPLTFAQQDVRILQSKANNVNGLEKSLSRKLPNQQTRNLPQEGANAGVKVASYLAPVAAAGGTVSIDGTLDTFMQATKSEKILNIINPPELTNDITFSQIKVEDITQFDEAVDISEKWFDQLNTQLQNRSITQQVYYEKLSQIQQYLSDLTTQHPTYATTKLYSDIADIKNNLNSNGVELQNSQTHLAANQSTIDNNDEKIQDIFLETKRYLTPTSPQIATINNLRTEILTDTQTMVDNQHTIDLNTKLISTLDSQTDAARIAQLLNQNNQLTQQNQNLLSEISTNRESLYTLDQKEYELIAYEQNNLHLNHDNTDLQNQITAFISDNDKLHLKLAAFQQHTYELTRPGAVTYTDHDALNASDFSRKSNEFFESLMKRQENIHYEIEHSPDPDANLWSYDDELNKIRYQLEQLIAQNPNVAHNWIENHTTTLVNTLTTDTNRVTQIDLSISHLDITKPADAAQIATLQAERLSLLDKMELLNIERTELEGMHDRLHEGLLTQSVGTAAIAEHMAIGIGLTSAAIFGGAVVGPFIGAIVGKVIGYTLHFFKCLFTGKWQKMRSTPFVAPKIKVTAIASCIGGIIAGAVKGAFLGLAGGPGGIIAGIILGGIAGGIVGFAGGALGAWLLQKLVMGWRNLKRKSNVKIDNKPIEIVKADVKSEKLV
ncbi:MAG: hypothetical protein WC860_02840 [Candidatus Margulisiibacteriota bacterium]|jgi:hypothetical protein